MTGDFQLRGVSAAGTALWADDVKDRAPFLSKLFSGQNLAFHESYIFIRNMIN